MPCRAVVSRRWVAHPIRSIVSQLLPAAFDRYLAVRQLPDRSSHSLHSFARLPDSLSVTSQSGSCRIARPTPSIPHSAILSSFLLTSYFLILASSYCTLKTSTRAI